nr:MAG TPA: hypothetical protein [Caudoviricetes sp.]
MEIKINGKIIKDTDFNGNTELLLEEIVYQSLNENDVVMKDKAITTMIDYKMARFSNEIFEEMGVKIIDRLDNGAVIVQDMGLYKN